MILYDIETRKSILEDRIKEATDTHERHYFEDRRAYLENISKKY